jgi:hypothetical protein
MTQQEASDLISRLLDNWPGLPAVMNPPVPPLPEDSSAEGDDTAMEP